MSGAISLPTDTGISHQPRAHALTPKLGPLVDVFGETLGDSARHRAERVGDEIRRAIENWKLVAEREQRVGHAGFSARAARRDERLAA